MGSAITSNVPLAHIAKAVLLVDHQGRKLMAVLPADSKINLSIINEKLFGSYQLIKEDDLFSLFSDCEQGAIPPVSEAFNINMVCDEALDNLERVFLESGDHETLLSVDHDTFEGLTAQGKHLRFSQQVFH
jgi:Ala-tRNA(Pro) deacylase